MKKIAVITSTRAEFGLLMPVIKALREYETENLKIELVVTGTHLGYEFGHTVDEIIKFQFRIDHEIEIPLKTDQEIDIATNQAETLKRFTNLFVEEKYSAAVLLGDRYEMLAIAVAAGNTKTPIFHLCGGDTTEGAIDEWIRHSITKMSYLHFVTNRESYKRVIQLGENPERVFNFGSTSIDNILNSAVMPEREALESLGMPPCKYAVCTYHPVTLDNGDMKIQMEEFFKAIQMFPEIEFIITKANADQGGAYINKTLEETEPSISNMHVYASLGVVRYLSLMKHAQFVLGNSSSGIIETPAFHIPTVNIGDRQKGRLQSESIINCHIDAASIAGAIKKAMTQEFRSLCGKVVSPYGDGRAGKRIAEKVVETVKAGNIDLKKKFYDMNMQEV